MTQPLSIEVLVDSRDRERAGVKEVIAQLPMLRSDGYKGQKVLVRITEVDKASNFDNLHLKRFREDRTVLVPLLTPRFMTSKIANGAVMKTLVAESGQGKVSVAPVYCQEFDHEKLDQITETYAPLVWCRQGIPGNRRALSTIRFKSSAAIEVLRCVEQLLEHRLISRRSKSKTLGFTVLAAPQDLPKVQPVMEPVLQLLLEARGLQSHALWQIPAGTNWQQECERALKAEHFVVFVSTACLATDSIWSMIERIGPLAKVTLVYMSLCRSSGIEERLPQAVQLPVVNNKPVLLENSSSQQCWGQIIDRLVSSCSPAN